MARMRKRGSHAAPVRPARPEQDGPGSSPAENFPADPASGGTVPGSTVPGSWSVTAPRTNGSGSSADGHGQPGNGPAGNGVLGNDTGQPPSDGDHHDGPPAAFGSTGATTPRAWLPPQPRPWFPGSGGPADPPAGQVPQAATPPAGQPVRSPSAWSAPPTAGPAPAAGALPPAEEPARAEEAPPPDDAMRGPFEPAQSRMSTPSPVPSSWTAPPPGRPPAGPAAAGQDPGRQGFARRGTVGPMRADDLGAEVPQAGSAPGAGPDSRAAAAGQPQAGPLT